MDEQVLITEGDGTGEVLMWHGEEGKAVRIILKRVWRFRIHPLALGIVIGWMMELPQILDSRYVGTYLPLVGGFMRDRIL